MKIIYKKNNIDSRRNIPNRFGVAVRYKYIYICLRRDNNVLSIKVVQRFWDVTSASPSPWRTPQYGTTTLWCQIVMVWCNRRGRKRERKNTTHRSGIWTCCKECFFLPNLWLFVGLLQLLYTIIPSPLTLAYLAKTRNICRKDAQTNGMSSVPNVCEEGKFSAALGRLDLMSHYIPDGRPI